MFGSWFYFRMGYLNVPVEHRGLAEDDVRLAAVITFGSILDALKPHQINGARTVCKVCDESFVVPFAYRVEGEYLSAELYIGHVAIYLAKSVDAAAVHILIRVICQEVANGCDAQFVGEEQGTVGPHTLQVFDVLAEDVHRIAKVA